MAECTVCGNEYDRSMEIRMQDRTEVFDCFEWAIQALAPTCKHCGCRIIGHGVEQQGALYCCGSGARADGARSYRA